MNNKCFTAQGGKGAFIYTSEADLLQSKMVLKQLSLLHS